MSDDVYILFNEEGGVQHVGSFDTATRHLSDALTADEWNSIMTQPSAEKRLAVYQSKGWTLKHVKLRLSKAGNVIVTPATEEITLT